MKYPAIFTIFILLGSACTSYNNTERVFMKSDLDATKVSAIESELPTYTSVELVSDLKESDIDVYTEMLQKNAHHGKTEIEDLIYFVLVKEEAVEKVKLHADTVSIYLFSNDSVNYFDDAPYLTYSWRYYSFHDIYAGFFHYDSVNVVKVFTEGNPDSELPASGDFDAMILEDGMLRKWYVLGMDYRDHIDVESEKCFDENYYVLPACMNKISP